MSKKVVKQRKRLAAIFASFSILIVGCSSLLESMSIDYYSVLDTLKKVVPAAFVMGCLGWVMGMIIDKPKTRKSLNFGGANLYMNNVLKNENVTQPSILDTPELGEGE